MIVYFDTSALAPLLLAVGLAIGGDRDSAHSEDDLPEPEPDREGWARRPRMIDAAGSGRPDSLGP